jgi:uncharacterized membrane protein YkgB
MNKEGELKPLNKEWHRENGTYRFSKYLGSLIVLIGILIVVKPLSLGLSAFGSSLLIVYVLLHAFLFDHHPEAWVQSLGDVFMVSLSFSFRRWTSSRQGFHHVLCRCRHSC